MCPGTVKAHPTQRRLLPASGSQARGNVGNGVPMNDIMIHEPVSPLIVLYTGPTCAASRVLTSKAMDRVGVAQERGAVMSVTRRSVTRNPVCGLIQRDVCG